MKRALLPPRREDLSQRVQWLLFFRLAVAVVGIVLTLLVEGGGVKDRAPYVLLITAVGLDLGYLAVLKRVKDLRRFAAVQIAIDGLIESALCYLTGGVYSFAAILYFGSILAASLCVSSRFSLTFALGATTALASIHVAYHVAAVKEVNLPFVAESVLDEHRIRLQVRLAAYVLSQGGALLLVAGLSSWLAQEIRRAHVLYSEILEKMAEGVIAIDADGKIVFVNGEALELLEYKKGDLLVGRNLWDVFRRQQDRDILESMRQQKALTVEIDVGTRDGKRRSIEVKTSVLYDERGVGRGTIGIFTDRTLARQAEDAEKRAERLEGIEALAMGIAHEVRNPLASIRGCVQELGRLDYLGDDERQLARIVCRESDRLDAIIGEFLQFARMKPPELKDLELANLLREVALLLRNRLPPPGTGSGSGRIADRGSVRIDLDVIENAHIRGDAKQLTQVFLNLGINAIEAMEKKGGTLTIALRDSRGVRHAPTPRGGFRILEDVRVYEVVFEDTGDGISAEGLQKIFEPFYTTKPGGTGLGLAIAERIVKLHGGTIVAESMPECGATFRVRIPAASPEGDLATDGVLGPGAAPALP
ncbi:MAG TPA: ATP-binding protein [Planctomycetota bacterium]|nr:ATP-binding protein [Planctomycetota bacterium]